MRTCDMHCCPRAPRLPRHGLYRLPSSKCKLFGVRAGRKIRTRSSQSVQSPLALLGRQEFLRCSAAALCHLPDHRSGWYGWHRRQRHSHAMVNRMPPRCHPWEALLAARRRTKCRACRFGTDPRKPWMLCMTASAHQGTYRWSWKC